MRAKPSFSTSQIQQFSILVLCCSLACTATGCYPRAAAAPGALSVNSVAFASTRWPGESEGSLARGRDLFVGSCNQCHGYPGLSSVAEERWPRVVEKMGKKAHLDAASRAAMLHYILAWRSDSAAR